MGYWFGKTKYLILFSKNDLFFFFVFFLLKCYINDELFISLSFSHQSAEAELAYELQAAKTKQRIKEEEMQIKVVERTQEITVQEQEILCKERELESTIRRPAEAEKFR